MNWYDFEENSNILEIEQDFDVNTDIEKKYDYIIIKDDIKKLEIAKKCLKQDGTIILCLNNRFGIRYFAGYSEEKLFSTICSDNTNLYSKMEIEQILQNNGFSNYKFFYPLPDYDNPNSIFSDDYLPCYTNTKLLYNTNYDEDVMNLFNEAHALKQVTKAGEFAFFANSYIVEVNPKKQPKFVSFNNSRKKEYRLITKIYDEYAQKIPASEDAKSHIMNMKKYIDALKKYDINIIDKYENGKIISKYINDKTLIENIFENIKNGNIEDSYNLIKKWYDFIKTKFEEQKVDKLNKDIKGYDELIDELTIVKKTYIDLVFENTFIEDDEFIFFDQEWCFDKLPLEFILYRAINNLYIYNSELEEVIPRANMYNKFGIYKFLELFQEIEKYIQNIVSDEGSNKKRANIPCISDVIENQKQQIIEKEKWLEEQNQYIKSLEEDAKGKFEKIQDLQEQLGLVVVDNEKKQEYINRLEQTINDLETYKAEKNKENDDLRQVIDHLNEIIKVKDNQISVYENMKAVKITKKLRGN